MTAAAGRGESWKGFLGQKVFAFRSLASLFASKYMLNRLFDILPVCLSGFYSHPVRGEMGTSCRHEAGQLWARSWHIQLHFIKFYFYVPSAFPLFHPLFPRFSCLVAFSGHCVPRVRVLKRKLRQETPDS